GPEQRGQAQEQIWLLVEPSERIGSRRRWRRTSHRLRWSCAGFSRATRPAVAMLQCRDLSNLTKRTAMGVDMLNIEGLKEMEHQGPIVMVNLMRFHERSLDGDGSGWDAYLRYSALTVPMIKARGGTLLWTGDAKAVALGRQDGNQWDYLGDPVARMERSAIRDSLTAERPFPDCAALHPGYGTSGS